MAIRILHADDHPLVRAGTHAVLADAVDICVVGEACDGYEAQKLCLELQPDVVLLDLDMPGPSAEETIRTIESSCKGVKIIILTAYDDEGYIRSLLECGIHGYILKNEAVDVIGEAIRTVMHGRFFFSQSIAEKLSDVNRAPNMLTPPEFEVLQLAGAGKSNKGIGEELSITERTVVRLPNTRLANRWVDVLE
jgi:DNA-binding NarL/FixJ family response regulator